MSELRPQVIRFSATVLASLGLYTAACVASPHLSLGAAGPLLTFVAVAVVVAAIAWSAPSVPWKALGFLVPPVALLVTLSFMQDAVPPAVLGGVVLVSLACVGGIIGGVVGSHVEHAGYLVLIAWVAAVVDLASVFAPSGPTAQIIEHMEQGDAVLPLVAIAWPVAGSSEIVPVLGMGDVTMSALLICAARINGMSVARAIVGLLFGFMVTLGLLIWLERALPALPMLCFGVVIALLPASARIPEEDRTKGVAFALLTTCAAIAAVAARL